MYNVTLNTVPRQDRQQRHPTNSTTKTASLSTHHAQEQHYIYNCSQSMSANISTSCRQVDAEALLFKFNSVSYIN